MPLTNHSDRRVRNSATIPLDAIEEKYAGLFPGKTGMPAKPLRMALGSLMIQKQYGYSDLELIYLIRFYKNVSTEFKKISV